MKKGEGSPACIAIRFGEIGDGDYFAVFCFSVCMKRLAGVRPTSRSVCGFIQTSFWRYYVEISPLVN